MASLSTPGGPSSAPSSPRLSICIATFKRARYIGETLRSVAADLPAGVEVVVVDGASPDDTERTVREIAAGCPPLRYVREPTNSGVDQDFDKAVGYARGEWCWLLSDDDILAPGAVSRVLAALEDGPDLVVVNSESRTPDLATVLDERFLPHTEDRDYAAEEWEAFFADTAKYLSFIGAVVIRRSAWLERERAAYYGSLFIHVGVIFQRPLARARVLARPLIRIRWGNSLWTPRAFEIWMFMWPGLVWSFARYSEAARAKVSPREPWRFLRLLGLHRAWGGYGPEAYERFIAPRAGPGFRLAARAIAAVPPVVANHLVAAYCLVAARWARREVYDMAYGPRPTWFARQVAKALGVAGRST